MPLAIVGICGMTGAFVVVAAMIGQRKRVCPSCGARALRSVAVRSTWSSNEGGTIESMFRCDGCRVELMRRGKGPYVPRDQWNQGARGELPEARLLDR